MCLAEGQLEHGPGSDGQQGFSPDKESEAYDAIVVLNFQEVSLPCVVWS